MVKLLNANDLLAEVVKAQALEPDKAVAKIIMYITEAEGVEVVRCKDCTHGDKYDNLPSYYFCMEQNRVVGENDYCSCGERKDNGL